MSEENLKVPAFDGHFEHRSELMENLLRAKKLWHLISPGIQEPTTGVAVSEAQRKKLEELCEKDLTVKHYLFQAIDRVTFEQIQDRSTSRSIWNGMRQRYEGNERVKRSTLQRLRREFEVLEMKAGEAIQEYFIRVLGIANQMRGNGEQMTDTKIVEKILRTLTERFVFIVVSIEESKYTTRMSVDELQSTLLVHEQKFKKFEKDEEKILKVDQEENAGNTGYTGRGRGRGRSNYRGRGRGRGRGSFNKETVECYKCHKLGHFQYECPLWNESNYVEFDDFEEMILMTTIEKYEEEGKLMMAST